MGLTGEQIVHGGEHQVRRALPGARVHGDGQQLSVAGDPGAEVGVQGRVVAGAAFGEVPEGGASSPGAVKRPQGSGMDKIILPAVKKRWRGSDGR